MTSITEVLSDEHRLVEELFQQYREAPDVATANRVCAELTAHAELEEQIVYPELGADVSQEMEEEAEHEHDEAKELISRIQQCDPEDLEQMSSLMTELEEGVSHHVREEETEILPAMEQALGQEEMVRLAEEYLEAKAEMLAAGGVVDVEEAERRLNAHAK